jgi:hypothetical protein
MLQPLAIAVIGGLMISMVLSLTVTPVVYFLLTNNRHRPSIVEENGGTSVDLGAWSSAAGDNTAN